MPKRKIEKSNQSKGSLSVFLFPEIFYETAHQFGLAVYLKIEMRRNSKAKAKAVAVLCFPFRRRKN